MIIGDCSWVDMCYWQAYLNRRECRFLFIIAAMLIKTLTIVAFLAIVISLGSALFHIVKHKEDSDSAKTAKALTMRIGLSLALFVLLFIAYATGMVQPHGIGARMHANQNPATATSNP
ncbi:MULTISPECIES: twin transmembrane helix small protein [unclassified Methylomonas]|uniref:twin transmembrane helix small protein n=1 Tax=unclassified Methylomonas TaxID=2608980 RepID=UPI0027E40D23|nr:twin transmembrane helix small protein [Methylomonas sp. LW13]